MYVVPYGTPVCTQGTTMPKYLYLYRAYIEVIDAAMNVGINRRRKLRGKQAGQTRR